MLLSTGLRLVAINATRRVFRHEVAMQRQLAGPQGTPQHSPSAACWVLSGTGALCSWRRKAALSSAWISS